MRKDRQLSVALINGLNYYSGHDFGSYEFPEDEIESAVDAIATDSKGNRMAIEHTLIQPYLGEKEDTQRFREVFVPLEDDPSLRLPGFDVQLWPGVGSVQKGTRKLEREHLRDTLQSWFRDTVDKLPKGRSVQTIADLPFTVYVIKYPHSDGRVFVGRSAVPDTFSAVVENALKTKLPKLVATSVEERILLLETDSYLDHEKLSSLIKSLASSYPALDKIDEVWVVDTVIWERSGTLWFSKVWPDGVSDVFELSFPQGSDAPILIRGVSFCKSKE